MKIGFFGGSFNPPTNAHIRLSKKAIKVCDLDKIVFVPMGDFYEKSSLAKAKDRYNMLEIACKDIKNMEVSDIEINVQNKLYAIDAFRLIENTYPNDEKYFIMGADNFINILNWKDSKRLIDKYNYIVFEREKIDLSSYIKENKEIQENKSKIMIIQNEEYKNISSSKVRKLLNGNIEPIQEFIPKGVLEYIIKNKIYAK